MIRGVSATAYGIRPHNWKRQDGLVRLPAPERRGPSRRRAKTSQAEPVAVSTETVYEKSFCPAFKWTARLYAGPHAHSNREGRRVAVIVNNMCDA